MTSPEQRQELMNLVEDARRSVALEQAMLRAPRFSPTEYLSAFGIQAINDRRALVAALDSILSAPAEVPTTPEIEEINADKYATLTDEQRAEMGLDWLDGRADSWAAETQLYEMTENMVSPMRLNRNAPDDVREGFIKRMREQIDAMIRLAYVEGAMFGLDAGRNERLRLLRALSSRESTPALTTATPKESFPSLVKEGDDTVEIPFGELRRE